MKERTRQVLENLEIASFMNKNRCHLKRSEEPRFGFVTLDDALAGVFTVRLAESEGSIEYASVGELLDDGWVLD